MTYTNSVQVYSTADSLLVRRIDVPCAPNRKSFHIVATRRSLFSDKTLWIACSDGRIYSVDWTTGSGRKQLVGEEHGHEQIYGMAVLALRIDEKAEEVVFVTQRSKKRKNKEQGMTLVGYRAKATQQKPHQLCSLTEGDVDISFLESSTTKSSNGRFLVAAAGQTVYVGVLQDSDDVAWNWGGEHYRFDCPDVIASLDVRSSKRKGKKGTRLPYSVVDIVVGGARGAIYHYHDVLARLGEGNGNLKPRLYHWHRRAVHALKWSRDGESDVCRERRAKLITVQATT